MSNVIRFLEGLGSDAAMGTESAYAEAVAGLEVDDAMRQALLARDVAEISRLLGGRDAMMLVLAPADDAPSDDDGEGDDDKEIRIAAAA